MSDHVSGKGLQRAELARRTNCNLETIRYYEKIGVMHSAAAVLGFDNPQADFSHSTFLVLRMDNLSVGLTCSPISQAKGR